MSIAEMKLKAINEITKLENEKALKEILEHLSKMSGESGVDKPLNLFQYYDQIKDQYGDTLQKLAQ